MNFTNVLTVFVAFLPMFLCEKAMSSDDVSYWVSRNFDEAPDVNSSRENIGKSERSYRPSILELGKGIPSGFRKDADIRLCFDNRPLAAARWHNLGRESYPSGSMRYFCEHYDLVKGIGYITHPKRLSTDSITKGLLISRNSFGKITCEAIFTMSSLFSVLSYRESYPDLPPISEIEIWPYGGMFPFGGDVLDKGLRAHLDPRDHYSIVGTVTGEPILVDLSLNHTWSCVAPAFRLYWSRVWSDCQEGSARMMVDPLMEEIEYPVLAELFDEIMVSTQGCYVGEGK
ncbi:hypothetical protein [uncultured Roseibium sp.]|uniref:hypothetical protein n=1 Tax=uncultured Roseibium sp. TaxID=1936171 RepID=UPI003217EB8B